MGAHKRFDCEFHNQTILSLLITTFLGSYFTGLQAIEYLEATFSIADSIYGSTFYIATGFHGIHVIVGTIFLIISRPFKNKSSFWPHCLYLILALCGYCMTFFIWL